MNKAAYGTIDRHQVAVSQGTEGFAQRLGQAAVTVFDTLLEWQERARQRAHLQSLDDRLLRDIGLSRADVEREASSPFWNRN